MKRFSRFFNRLRSEENGAVAVMIAIAMVALMSVCSFAVDTGIVYYEKSKLQSAVDSAALAAARELPDTSKAEQVAIEYLEKNGFSADDAIIEFSEENTVVRVSDSSQTKTLFASLFNVDKINNNAVAAAKFYEESKKTTFPFLLFSGSKNTNLNLGGMFHIYGGVHSNASANVYANTAATIESLEACGTVNDGNRLVKNGTKSYADYYDMPDYDAQIMAMVPTFPTTNFNIKNSWPVPTQDCYFSSSSNAKYFTKIPGTVYEAVTKTYTIHSSIHVRDAFQTGDYNIIVLGDVYCDSTFAMSRYVTIKGNLYVNGALTSQGSTQLLVGGNIYAVGNINLASNGGVGNVFGGDVYTESYFKLSGGCPLSADGSIYSKKYISMASSVKTIKGSVYAFTTCEIYGVADVYGDIYSGGNLTFSGNFPSVTTHGGAIYCGATFNCAQGFNTNGVFVAEGNINIGGMPSTINDKDATVALYSRTGTITLSPGTGMLAYGMIYAPHGAVNFWSGNMTFYGSIIADSYGFGPGGLELGENPRTMPFESAGKVKKALLVE